MFVEIPQNLGIEIPQNLVSFVPRPSFLFSKLLEGEVTGCDIIFSERIELGHSKHGHFVIIFSSSTTGIFKTTLVIF